MLAIADCRHDIVCIKGLTAASVRTKFSFQFAFGRRSDENIPIHDIQRRQKLCLFPLFHVPFSEYQLSRLIADLYELLARFYLTFLVELSEQKAGRSGVRTDRTTHGKLDPGGCCTCGCWAELCAIGGGVEGDVEVAINVFSEACL